MALWRKVYVAVREVNEMKVDRWILSLLTLGTNYPQRDGMRWGLLQCPTCTHNSWRVLEWIHLPPTKLKQVIREEIRIFHTSKCLQNYNWLTFLTSSWVNPSGVETKHTVSLLAQKIVRQHLCPVGCIFWQSLGVVQVLLIWSAILAFTSLSQPWRSRTWQSSRKAQSGQSIRYASVCIVYLVFGPKVETHTWVGIQFTSHTQ